MVSLRDHLFEELEVALKLSDDLGRVIAKLATGAGILKTAKLLSVGTGTVHRVKRSMTAVAA